MNLTRFHAVSAFNFKRHEYIAPRRTTTGIDSDKPRAPMNGVQRPKTEPEH
jgi:hypothetical protein